VNRLTVRAAMSECGYGALNPRLAGITIEMGEARNAAQACSKTFRGQFPPQRHSPGERYLIQLIAYVRISVFNEFAGALVKAATLLVLFAATFPFIYYLITIWSAIHFFGRRRPDRNVSFTPPVSNLKPIRGIDPDAYENFASLCRQNYPEFELLFCVSDRHDPIVAVIEKLAKDFPDRQIRILYGSGRSGVNDKVAKLARLTSEAKYEYLVINDSDVRVDPDYFRTIIAPLADPERGAVTCLYRPIGEHGFTDRLQNVGMMSDFFAGIITAWQLEGVKFALGTTIATTKTRLSEFGGYESLENRPADDLLVGRLIAEQGHEVELLPYSVLTVSDYASMRQLLFKRMRWIVVMRHMRPAGHFGLIFTQGLVWSLIAIAVHPGLITAAVYLGLYCVLRAVMTLLIGAWGIGQKRLWLRLPLIPLWDAVAFLIWLVSFTRSSIRWRDGHYHIRDGQLVPVTRPASAGD
jgi:ceramide glucosyltransferase